MFSNSCGLYLFLPVSTNVFIIFSLFLLSSFSYSPALLSASLYGLFLLWFRIYIVKYISFHVFLIRSCENLLVGYDRHM